MREQRCILAVCVVSCALLLCTLPLSAQDQVNHAIRFAVSQPLSELEKMPQSPQWGFHEANPVRRIAKPEVTARGDSAEQSIQGPEAGYSVIANFLGVGNGFPGYSVPDAPPDTNMAVGDTQIVQWVNVSYVVCSKTAPYTCGSSIEGNLIWSKLGGPCASNNSGDPIAQWDVQAHRWLLAQNIFSGNYGVCVAVSTTSDATGTYNLYEFPVVNNGFPDYPKWGVWVNNYGETWNNFGTGSYVGPVFCAYNRTKMLAGDKTAEQICHQYGISPNYNDSLLPADLDSATLPPSGEDQFAIGSVGDIDNSHLSLYSVHINNPADWTQGATFTGDNDDQLVAISTFTPACNGSYGGACVPQKGVSDKLDSLGDRLMYRFAYWNEGGSGNQHWLVDFDVTGSNSQNAVRWEDFYVAGQAAVQPTALTVNQEGTYAPDANWRWMGSVARDKAGDILVGYSESASGMYPSIYVAGRTPSDPAGTLESEVQLVAGAGSQPDTSNRWGDYSSMRIDQDGCTFWYTTEYYKTTAQFDWSTQIGSFQFANCSGGGGGPAVSLSPTSLKWGKVLVGTQVGKKKVTLTNTGTASLSISNIATTGDFLLVPVKQTKKVTPCVNGGTVAAGASCVVRVAFKPTQTGLRTGQLQFTDNAPDSPQSVALTGTGK